MPWIGQSLITTNTLDGPMYPAPWQLSRTGHVQPFAIAASLPGFGIFVFFAFILHPFEIMAQVSANETLPHRALHAGHSTGHTRTLLCVGCPQATKSSPKLVPLSTALRWLFNQPPNCFSSRTERRALLTDVQMGCPRDKYLFADVNKMVGAQGLEPWTR